MSPRIRVAGVLLTGWLLTGPATALPPVGPVNVADLGDLAHRLFVADGERTALAVIDTAGDRLLGTLDIGLVPRQLAVSSALSRLVATDGRSGRVVVVDLTTGLPTAILVDFPAERVALAPDGMTAAIADLAGGTVAFVDLVRGGETARARGLPPLRDVMFGADGKVLYLASSGLRGIGVLEVASGRPAGEIALATPDGGGVAGLSRSPDGRTLYARPAAGGPVSVLDPAGARPPATVAAGPGAVAAVPSGTGAYLVIPDDAERGVAIVHDGERVVLAGAAGMGGGVASAWFDTVAFIPSRAERKLLVYDLETLSAATPLGLPGAPRAATVTPDGGKLYVPLEDAGTVAVIDARSRRLTGLIAVLPHPVAAAMAASWGICH